MSTTFVTIALEAETCCNCGVAFGLEASHMRRLRDGGGWFYCPNGHSQHYTRTTVQRLAQELAAEKARAERAIVRADTWKATGEHKQRTIVALRGHQTRLKKRIAAGKCPCCHEEFSNVAKHIAAKHPGYGSEPMPQ
jgi:hypothetical protein